MILAQNRCNNSLLHKAVLFFLNLFLLRIRIFFTRNVFQRRSDLSVCQVLCNNLLLPTTKNGSLWIRESLIIIILHEMHQIRSSNLWNAFWKVVIPWYILNYKDFSINHLYQLCVDENRKKMKNHLISSGSGFYLMHFPPLLPNVARGQMPKIPKRSNIPITICSPAMLLYNVLSRKSKTCLIYYLNIGIAVTAI